MQMTCDVKDGEEKLLQNCCFVLLNQTCYVEVARSVHYQGILLQTPVNGVGLRGSF